jgi:hypothetical protein
MRGQTATSRQRHEPFHRDNKKCPIRSNGPTHSRAGRLPSDRAENTARVTRRGQLLQHVRRKSVVVDVWSGLAQLSIQLIFLTYFIHFD